jgi:hypothetical protein
MENTREDWHRTTIKNQRIPSKIRPPAREIPEKFLPWLVIAFLCHQPQIYFLIPSFLMMA